MGGTLRHTGFQVGPARLQRLHRCGLLLENGEQRDDHVLHDVGRVLPAGPVQRQPCWKRQKGGHRILPRLMNTPTAGASAAMVIAKNPPKGQSLEQGILLGIILTGYPLNHYGSCSFRAGYGMMRI